MNIKYRMTLLLIGLALTFGTATSWAQLPGGNDTSDEHGNTGGGTWTLLNNGPNGGWANTAYGFSSLQQNNTGSWNTAFGSEALYNNTSGESNTAVGDGALGANNSGSWNTATGSGALSRNIGSQNTATGFFALLNNISGYNNTALGYQALYSNTTGSQNLALGWNAGYFATGSYNIYLANYGVASESNTMRLGWAAGLGVPASVNAAITKRTFIAGIFGVPVSGSQVLINSNGQLGVLASSARYKRDIQDMGDRTDGLLKLRPVTFRYKQDPEAALQYGLIAEEVANVYPELVVRGANGEVESVQYHQIISMLLNEVQHQQKALDAQSQQISAQSQQIGAQSQQIAELKAQSEEQQAHNATLETRLDRLEAQAARTGMLATSYERSF